MWRQDKDLHKMWIHLYKSLGGGFKSLLFWKSHPYLGKIFNLTHIFQMGLKPPTRCKSTLIRFCPELQSISDDPRLWKRSGATWTLTVSKTMFVFSFYWFRFVMIMNHAVNHACSVFWSPTLIWYIIYKYNFITFTYIYIHIDIFLIFTSEVFFFSERVPFWLASHTPFLKVPFLELFIPNQGMP